MSTPDHETRFREFVAAVPASVARSHVESVVNRFMATYTNSDVETRLSLFAEQLNFEDPVGHRLASNRTELQKFFDETVATGGSFRFFPERLIVVGDEALQVARLLIEHGETDRTLLLLHLHLVFDSAGLITQVRAFYDESCASKPLA
jgi:ketosteroid isomerase-like protein